MSGNPNDKPKYVEKYYHYTDEAGAKGIKESKMIRVSQKTIKDGDDVKYGVGVYFTQLDPKHTKGTIASNNYDGTQYKAEEMVERGRVDYVVMVEIPINDTKLKNVGTKGRDVHLYVDGCNLMTYTHEISKVADWEPAKKPLGQVAVYKVVSPKRKRATTDADETDDVPAGQEPKKIRGFPRESQAAKKKRRKDNDKN